MNAWIQLLMIAAMWGASHVLVRIATPVFGPEWVAWFRVFIGSSVMLVYVKLSKKQFNLHLNWIPFVVVGLLNGAIPFLMFAKASLFLPASYLSILNSTTPIFSALLAVFLMKESFSLRRVFGMGLGIAGVALVEECGVISFREPATWLALGEGLLAGFCYALAGIYIKQRPRKIDSEVLIAGSFGISSVLMLPAVFYSPVSSTQFLNREPTHLMNACLCVAFLGVGSSAFAFLLYYRLIEKIGPFRSSLVTFMIPIFGILWSVLFLHERFVPMMALGVGMIMISTALFIKKSA
jgi:hypothetical protein